MDNTTGLLLICCCLASLLAFVAAVSFIASRSPKSKLGRAAKAIDNFIDRLPD